MILGANFWPHHLRYVSLSRIRREIARWDGVQPYLLSLLRNPPRLANTRLSGEGRGSSPTRTSSAPIACWTAISRGLGLKKPDKGVHYETMRGCRELAHGAHHDGLVPGEELAGPDEALSRKAALNKRSLPERHGTGVAIWVACDLTKNPVRPSC